MVHPHLSRRDFLRTSALGLAGSAFGSVPTFGQPKGERPKQAEGVTVLNVNDLSSALKTVVLPGETMSVFVMKDGKEREQGVGYLDDGTMVVIEDGKRQIGKRVDATVTSIHQTSNGRMIFAKARPAERPQSA